MKAAAPILGYYWSPGDGDVSGQVELLIRTGANTVVIPGKFLDRIPIELLRGRGMRIIADWSVFVGEEIRTRFPDSVPVNASGRPYERDGWYVPACPNHPQLRRRHIDALAQLLERHGPQLFGLWLDFIRYPVRWEGAAPPLPQVCFCRHCLNLFLGEERAGYSGEETQRLARAILAERRDEWVDWKCSRIVAFAEEVRRLIDGCRLDIQLGVFSLPWRQADFDGALRAVACQDLDRLARVVNTFSPMVYHRLCGQDVAWVADVIRDAQQAVSKESRRAVLPIVQAMDRPDRLSPQELDAALAAGLATDTAGVLIFTLDAVQEDAAKVAAVARRFGA